MIERGPMWLRRRGPGSLVTAKAGEEKRQTNGSKAKVGFWFILRELRRRAPCMGLSQGCVR